METVSKLRKASQRGMNRKNMKMNNICQYINDKNNCSNVLINI